MSHADRPREPKPRLWRVEFMDGGVVTVEAEYRAAARYYARRFFIAAGDHLRSVKSARLLRDEHEPCEGAVRSR